MTPDALLRLYPRETLRWWRGRLALSQLGFAVQVGVALSTMSRWEARQHPLSDRRRKRLALLLAPHLATPAGEAFARSLGRGEEAGE